MNKASSQRGITEVVAALIWDKGNYDLPAACPIRRGGYCGNLWAARWSRRNRAQALIRECREELDITLAVGEVFMEVVHEYPDLTVHLTLFHAAIASGVPKKLEHNDIRWITPWRFPNMTSVRQTRKSFGAFRRPPGNREK